MFRLLSRSIDALCDSLYLVLQLLWDRLLWEHLQWPCLYHSFGYGSSWLVERLPAGGWQRWARHLVQQGVEMEGGVEILDLVMEEMRHLDFLWWWGLEMCREEPVKDKPGSSHSSAIISSSSALSCGSSLLLSPMGSAEDKTPRTSWFSCLKVAIIPGDSKLTRMNCL